ncbi:MAG: hypothetical protein ACRDZO_12345, partial [Egibacteraceae bacterium]
RTRTNHNVIPAQTLRPVLGDLDHRLALAVIVDVAAGLLAEDSSASATARSCSAAAASASSGTSGY